MTPEQLALLEALKEAVFGGGAPGGADRISAVDRKVQGHVDGHPALTVPPLKARFPGATVTIPPVDADVEPA